MKSAECFRVHEFCFCGDVGVKSDDDAHWLASFQGQLLCLEVRGDSKTAALDRLKKILEMLPLDHLV